MHTNEGRGCFLSFTVMKKSAATMRRNSTGTLSVAFEKQRLEKSKRACAPGEITVLPSLTFASVVENSSGSEPAAVKTRFQGL